MTVVRALSMAARLLDAIPLRLALLGSALLWRHAGRIARDHDVLIGGNNETD